MQWRRNSMRPFSQAAGYLILTAAATSLAWSQAPGSAGATGHSTATQQPLSGGPAQWGSAQASETATSSGVSTVNSSVQVTGNLAGSVPSTDVPAGPIHLSIADAVRRA